MNIHITNTYCIQFSTAEFRFNFNFDFFFIVQIKQARKFVEQEQKARAKAKAERDNLQKQLQGVKDLLLADGGKTINNETLERIR